jgi:Uma2 family endonuclease
MPAPVLSASREERPKDVKLWTRKECEFLVSSGLLDERYELIEGEIILKMGQNRPHSMTLFLISLYLEQVFGRKFIQTQLPVVVGAEDKETNEPEPDIAVLEQEFMDYGNRKPGVGDIVLVVEVADSTLARDTKVKPRLYARAEFPEYWVADVEARQMWVHRNPSPNGYGVVTIYSETEEIAPLSHPDAKVKVADLFPKPDQME